MITMAILGLPNTGKSTFFNRLTKKEVKTANYPGVTVTRSSGIYQSVHGKKIELVDLPGVRHVDPQSVDEKLAYAEASSANTDGILLFVDGTNLRNQLGVMLRAASLKKPCMMVVTMMDMARRDGTHVDAEKLAALTGVPCVLANVNRQAGCMELIGRLEKFAGGIAAQSLPVPEVPSLSWPETQLRARAIADQVIVKQPSPATSGLEFTKKVDRFLLHPLWGSIVLVGIFFAIFQLIFTVSAWPSARVEDFFAFLQMRAQTGLPEGLVRDFIVQAVIGGVGSVLVFLPPIAMLLFALLILENSGYMARAAYMTDSIMRRFGLQGSSVIPLLSSLACAVPGIMATRHLPTARDRLITILITPLMPCAARLPVYILLVGAFIPAHFVGGINLQGLVMFALYLIGVLSALIAGLVINRLVKRTHAPVSLTELPRYRFVSFGVICKQVWLQLRGFLRRVGTIILVSTAVLWAFLQFPPGAENVRETFAGAMGAFLLPILKPLGFSLEMAIALIPGMAAREVAVSSLAAIYGVQGDKEGLLAHSLAQQWPLASALAFLAWYIYAPQCLSTIVAIRKETASWSWTGFALAYLFLLAYVAAALMHAFASAMLG